MKQILFSLLMLVFMAVQMGAQTTVNITDLDLQPNQTYNWTKNNVYLLDGLVFVEDGAVLNIEAGTVVKFTDRADIDNPSALIIARGGKIFAEGTAEEPIIFTAEADDVNNPNDLGPSDVSLWGGLAILGRGITERSGNAFPNLEGILTTEPRGNYGGTDNTDNSGVLRYVSIRHGGRVLQTAGNELNGLGLGAVGSGTTLEYIEVYANSDDGIEFFGGAPNLKYAVVAFAEDDSYDWDEAYVGKGQFWFSIQRADAADSAGELDGSTPDDDTPNSNPTLFNWTHIGPTKDGAATQSIGWFLRAGTAGTIANSILVETKARGLEVQDKGAMAMQDAYARLESGDLKILNNLFFNIGNFTTLDANATTGIVRASSTAVDPNATSVVNHLVANLNAVSNPEIQGISRAQDKGLDPRPAGNTAVTSNLATYPNDPFFSKVNYKGAFSPLAGGLWIRGWSSLDRNGHLKDLSAGGQTVFVNDNSILPCDNVTWTKDKSYVVDGLTFVDSCATLTIEAGTVVKFTDRADIDNPSALIVARGGKIFAEGTAEEPIIFTAEADDVNDPNDLGPSDVSLWGGLAILGRGITERSGNAFPNLEGILTSERRGNYGGTDNTDNSGVLRYVSIRHGGRVLQTAGNELNGLGLGAVGSGTTLEYIEVYANSDDGIEFFGGAPNLKYAVVAFAEDDSYDWDEAYVGKGQFWFSIQRADAADSAGELDGSTPDDDTPNSNPTLFNWTHIGPTKDGAATQSIGWNLRAGTAGTIANSILVETKAKGLEVQDKGANAMQDAYARLESGDLKILNNLFFNIGNFTTLDANPTTGIVRASSTAVDPNATSVVNHLVANLNAVSNPQIQSISRVQDKGLDPRPAGNTAVTSNLATYPNDPFFSKVNYKGAFSPLAGGLWVRGWSSLDRNGHLKDLSAGGQTVFVNDNSILPCDNVTWTKDKSYVVDGLTFVDSCATLTIEAGTVVKFTDRADIDNPSALIVARGGKIFAEGTAQEPIIFTAEADDVNDPTDLGPSDVSLWGGLAILGRGITERSGNAFPNLEGILTSERRGNYGGTDNTDNSGVLRYVSIRHGGRVLQTAGNELNGLGLGAVGSGTTLEYIEVYANSDDGIEFFGGAPNVKYAVVAFAEDDSYDWDEAYVGKGQFWFSIQRADAADAAGELDGSTPDDDTPNSNPTLFNWTHIGPGKDGAATQSIGWFLRAGTAGVIANSIQVETKGKALEVQDKGAGAMQDAYARLESGDLKILNNIFHNTGNGNGVSIDASTSGIIRASATAVDLAATSLVNHLIANQTTLFDPYIRSINRDQANQLDPRPCSIGSAYTSPLAALPGGDPFFTAVDFKGAFSDNWNNLWIRDWTALARNSHLVSTPVEACPLVGTNDLDGNLLNVFRIYPNPTSQNFMVESKFDESVNVEIFDMSGRLITQRLELAPGTQQVTINELTPGMYLIKFITEDGKNATKKLIVE